MKHGSTIMNLKAKDPPWSDELKAVDACRQLITSPQKLDLHTDYILMRVVDTFEFAR